MADDMPNVYESAAGATASAPKAEQKSKGKLANLDIEVTDDGGFIIKERYRSKSKDIYGGPTLTKVASDRKELDAILDECLGLSDAYAADGTAEDQ